MFLETTLSGMQKRGGKAYCNLLKILLKELISKSCDNLFETTVQEGVVKTSCISIRLIGA